MDTADSISLPIEIWHRIAFDVGGLSPKDVGALRSTSTHFRWMFEAAGVDLVKWQALAGLRLCLKRKHLDAAARCLVQLGHTLDSITGDWAAELACSSDHVPLLKALLSVGFEPGLYELNIAASWGNPGVAEVLLDFGVVPDYEAVVNASRKGYLDVLKLILDRGPPDIYLYEGLADACHKGHKEVVRYLLERGCDPIHEDPAATAEYERGDHAPLYEACQRNHAEIVTMLLEVYPTTGAGYDQWMVLSLPLSRDGSDVIRVLLSDPRCILTPQLIARTIRLCVAFKAYKCLRAFLEDRRFDATNFLKAAKTRWGQWFRKLPQEATEVLEKEDREPHELWESPLALLYAVVDCGSAPTFLFKSVLLVTEMSSEEATRVLHFACSRGREWESKLLIEAGAVVTQAALRAGFEEGHYSPALLPGADLETARAAGLDDLVAEGIRYNSVIPFFYTPKTPWSFDPLPYVLEVAVIRGLRSELENLLERHCGTRLDFALAHVAALAQKHNLPEIAEMVEDF